MAIEHRDVRLGIQQALRLVLPVDGGEPRRQIAQHAHGHEGAVDRRLSLAGDMDLAPQHQLFTLHRQAVLLARPRGGGTLEDRLDDRAVFAGPDQLGGSPRPEQQPQRVDEDRFAGARLAGQEAQAGAELQLQLGDDGYVTDPEQLEHRGGPARQDSTSSRAL